MSSGVSMQYIGLVPNTTDDTRYAMDPFYPCQSYRILQKYISIKSRGYFQV